MTWHDLTCTLKVPVLDNWWQTETAHAITSTCVGLGNSLQPPKDVTGVPLPGFDGERASEQDVGVKKLLSLNLAQEATKNFSLLINLSSMYTHVSLRKLWLIFADNLCPRFLRNMNGQFSLSQ